jgi:hypothetical protein
MVNSQGDFKWEVQPEQITRFAEKALAGKTLRPPEDFYFEGAEGKRVHGFVVKPYGWKEGDKKKWAGVLLIHGGMLALAEPIIIQYTETTLQVLKELGTIGGQRGGTQTYSHTKSISSWRLTRLVRRRLVKVHSCPIHPYAEQV